MSAIEPDKLVKYTRKFLAGFSKYLPKDETEQVDLDNYHVLVLKFLEMTDGMGISIEGIDKSKLGERIAVVTPLLQSFAPGFTASKDGKIFTQYQSKLSEIEQYGLKDVGKLHALYSYAVFHQAWSDFNTILNGEDSLIDAMRDDIIKAIQTYLLAELLAPKSDLTFVGALATNLQQLQLLSDEQLLVKLNVAVKDPSAQQKKVEQEKENSAQLSQIEAGSSASGASASSSSSFFQPPQATSSSNRVSEASELPIPPPQPQDNSNFWLQAGIVIVAVVLGVGAIGYMNTNSPGK